MWWKQSVVYQVYPKSFYDSNGDGLGDIKGIIEKLDYLEYLGVDVIWLCPVYPSPNKDNGYDISDYYGIHEDYGTLDDMKLLIEKAAAKGISIMMDIVANHTSSEHEWFKEARKSKVSPYHEFYVFKENLGHLPSDLQSIFLNSAWTYNEETDEYYLHMFDQDQPDLNWHNEAVRKAIYKILKYWIDLGVKGFRFDVIDLIAKDLDNNIIGDGPKLHTYIKEMATAVLKKHDLITVGETWGADAYKAMQYSNPDQSEFSMIFNFQHSLLDQVEGKEKWDLKPLDLLDLKHVFNEQQTLLYEKGWNSLFWNNHDLPRIVSRWGDDTVYRVESSKMLATLLHFMQGTPYIYQGEELGMTNCMFEDDEYKDIETLNMIQDRLKRGFSKEEIDESLKTKGRDNARTPFHWDDSFAAGFTKGDPWIKVNPNYRFINAKNQMHDESSVLEYYRKLIYFRRHSQYNTLIEKGTFKLIEQGHKSLFAYERTYKHETIKVYCNFYDQNISALSLDLSGQVILSNYTQTAQTIKELRPYEALVIYSVSKD